jgi:hypothetical protein
MLPDNPDRQLKFPAFMLRQMRDRLFHVDIMPIYNPWSNEKTIKTASPKSQTEFTDESGLSAKGGPKEDYGGANPR